MIEPRKTPRSDKAAILIEGADYGDATEYVKSDFARALEIEMHELAEALEKIAKADPLENGRYAAFRASAALARHRAAQEGKQP